MRQMEGFQTRIPFKESIERTITFDALQRTALETVCMTTKNQFESAHELNVHYNSISVQNLMSQDPVSENCSFSTSVTSPRTNKNGTSLLASMGY